MNALKLRRVDAQTHTRAQLVQRWQLAGQVAGLGRPQRKTGYLRFRALGDGGDWHGLIAARDWLHHSLPSLQSLLTVECSLASIAGLFKVVPRPLLLHVKALHYRELCDIEYLASTQLPTDDLPWLDTPRGRVWLTQLPPTHAAYRPLEHESWLSDLPLRLELVLGISHVTPATLVRLKERDVLRIIHRTRQCWLANRCIGAFTFTEEGIHMQSTDADADQQSKPDVDLGSLPVRLEFVLATHEIDLATLSKIIDGQLIPLADDAALHIEVRANGKPVARGELVQLEQQLGVELLEVYRNTALEHPQ